MVCMGCVATPQTGELGLTPAVLPPRQNYVMAGQVRLVLRGVDEHQHHACLPGFVDQKLLQLPKTPVILLRLLPLTFRHPVADPGQLFQDQRGLRVFGILTRRLARVWFYPPLKARYGSWPSAVKWQKLSTLRIGRLVGLACGVAARFQIYSIGSPVYVCCRPSRWQDWLCPGPHPATNGCIGVSWESLSWRRDRRRHRGRRDRFAP